MLTGSAESALRGPVFAAREEIRCRAARGIDIVTKVKRLKVFREPRARPAASRTVARWRLGDADCLAKTGQAERANGAMYLGGLAIEIMLKAALLRRYPWLQEKVDHKKLSKADERVWSLCFRSHDLDKILDRLGYLEKLLEGPDRALWFSIQPVLSWTIYARYSPQPSTSREAVLFVAKVKEFCEWIERRST